MLPLILINDYLQYFPRLTHVSLYHSLYDTHVLLNHIRFSAVILELRSNVMRPESVGLKSCDRKITRTIVPGSGSPGVVLFSNYCDDRRLYDVNLHRSVDLRIVEHGCKGYLWQNLLSTSFGRIGVRIMYEWI